MMRRSGSYSTVAFGLSSTVPVAGNGSSSLDSASFARAA